MMGTIECIYETPCHWCSKWDKKCDRKIKNENPYEDIKELVRTCKHEWEPTISGGANTKGNYITYRCKKCGKLEDRYDS